MQMGESVKLQKRDDLYLRIGFIISLLLALALLWGTPTPTPHPYRPKKIKEVKVDVVEQTEVIQEPTEPQVVQKPKQVVEADSDDEADEEDTIADTSLDLSKQAVKTDIPSPDAFIPFSNPPITISKPAPEYPELARKAGLEGVVALKVFIGTDGTVKSVVLLKGVSEALDKAAMAAAWKARFKPAENNGKKVAVWYGLSYRFSLN